MPPISQCTAYGKGMPVKPPPPSLGDAGREFWEDVTSVYALSPAEYAILRRACAAMDRLAQIDAALSVAEMSVEGSRGQLRAHPLLVAANDAERTLDVLIRALSFPMPDETTGKRRSPQAVAAAQQRWRDKGVGAVGI